MSIQITRESAAVLEPRIYEALEIVCNEFRGLEVHQRYRNVFSRLLKPDPLGRVAMMGTDQRDLFCPVLRNLIASHVPEDGSGAIFDFGAGDGQTFGLVADAVPDGTTISLEEPSASYLKDYVSFLERDARLRVGAVLEAGIDEIDAAQIVAVGAWTRPVAALALGLLGDRFGISRMALVCFALLIISHSLFAFTGTALGTLSMILLNTLVTGIAIFGLRGLYFGLMEEGQIPLAVTGTAVGLVSVIGYTPDVYIAAVAGYLIDQSPGLAGFQHLFVLLLGFSVVGAMAAIAFEREARAASVTDDVNSR